MNQHQLEDDPSTVGTRLRMISLIVCRLAAIMSETCTQDHCTHMERGSGSHHVLKAPAYQEADFKRRLCFVRRLSGTAPSAPLSSACVFWNRASVSLFCLNKHSLRCVGTAGHGSYSRCLEPNRCEITPEVRLCHAHLLSRSTLTKRLCTRQWATSNFC